MNDPSGTRPSGTRTSGRRRRWAAGAVAVALVAGGAVTAVATLTGNGDGAGEPVIVDRAAQVMPFDLNTTLHTFTKTPGGGVQEVVADDPADSRNVELIRRHLRAEAGRFSRGDFGDPATIHGDAMPGLRELRAGAAGVQVVYQDLPSGARITYGATDPALVTALHAWFDAQNTDHAAPGMGGGA